MARVSTIQFGGLDPHFKSGDDVRVTFFYEAGSLFTPKLGDWVGVFLEGDVSPEEALALVKVPDPSTHQFCDGGRRKTGSVSVKLPDTASGRCEFWYVSPDSKVMAKSNGFTVCVDDIAYPSLDSVDEPALLKGIQSCSTSYVDIGLQSCTTSYVDAGEILKSECHTSDSSFVLVSEEDSLEPPGSDYVMAQAETKPLDTTESGVIAQDKPTDGPSFKVVSSIEEPEHSDRAGYERREKLSSTPSEKPDETALPVEPIDLVKTKASPLDDLRLKEIANDHNLSRSDISSSSSDSSSTSSSSSSSHLDPEIVEMSNSTVIIEKHITQREARTLKTANKDLRAKVNKLSRILDEKKAEIEQLTKTADENKVHLVEVNRVATTSDEAKTVMESEISSLKVKLLKSEEREKELNEQLQALRSRLRKSEDIRSKTETLGKKLIVEKSTLEEKVRQLSQENKTIFERSSKLLSQLLDSETKREIEKSEKQVLEGKIDYLVSELRKVKESPFKPISRDDKSGKESRQPHKPVPRYHESSAQDPNHHRAKRNESGMAPPSRAHLPPATTRRPNELPLGASNGQANHKREEPSKQGATNIVGQKQPAIVNGQQAIAQRQKQQVTVNGQQQAMPQQQIPSKYGHEIVETKAAHPKRGSEGYQTLREGSTRGGCGAPWDDEVVKSKNDTGRGESSNGSVESKEGISEERIGIIAEQLRGDGDGGTVVECPICGKVLHARENEYAVTLHVEHCIQLSELMT